MSLTTEQRYDPTFNSATPGAGNGGRGPVSLGAAIRRHPIVAILPAIILLAAGVAVGYAKHPTYSASATINVGKSDIATQATPGYVQAAEGLSSAYSRVVQSQHIAIPVAQALHESESTVGSSLSAVPIPNEPTFTITGTATSAHGAVSLVNRAVTALQAYVQSSASQQGGPTQLLTKYQAAQALADHLRMQSNRLQGQFDSHTSGVTSAQVQRAQVAAQTAALQAQGLSNQYLSLSGTTVGPQLDVLQSPTGASATNRTTNIEKYGVIGGVAGLVIGISLAALLGDEPSRRRAVYAS
jgi:hypothetical protein